MNYTTEIFRKPLFWIFIYSLAMIHGASFHVMDIMDAREMLDCQTYLGLANFDFDQYVVRKYRVIIPFIASGINYLFGDLFIKLSPWSFPGDFGLSLSFLIVNNLIMSLAGALLFKLIYAYTQNNIASFLGLTSMLTCRWTGMIAGMPLVDSLYILIIILTILGLKTNNHRYLIISIFFGPWAKESFLFVAPLIFFFSTISKQKQFIYFTISGILVFSSRFLIDHISNGAMHATLAEDFDHFNNIWMSMRRIFSFHGVYEIFSITGFWVILLFFVFTKNGKKTFQHFGGIEYGYIASCIIQVLLSSDIARMLYLLTPVLAILWAIIIHQNLPILFNYNNKNTPSTY